MGVSGKDLLWLPATVGQHWVKLACRTTHWYAALLDPRPDLAVPARSVRTPYVFWWW
jgi:hypothetical protein